MPHQTLKHANPTEEEELALDSLEMSDLTGIQKSALFLISMGSDTAAAVLRELREDEVKAITLAVAKMKNVPSDLIEPILVEYKEMDEAQNSTAVGGEAMVQEMLERTYGPHKAEEMMMQLEAEMEVSAFHLLQTVETAQLTNFLQNEHPQTCALILSHLHPRKSADILGELKNELRDEIVYRLATMGKTSPELLKDIEDVIRGQLGSVFGADLSSTGGYENVAEILGKTSRTTEREIMEAIRGRDEEVAVEIKNLMFVFDDLAGIQGRDLQRILTEVDQRDLALSLKNASKDLKEKIMSNVSERVAASIEEELELMGKVRVRDVDEAQRRILDIAQELENEEEVILTTGEEEALI